MSLSIKGLAALEDIVEQSLLDAPSDSEDVNYLAARAEIQCNENARMTEDCVRVSRVIGELEQQNDTIENVVQTEGELSPSAAAGFEAARRAALVSVGIDAESSVGRRAIDRAGLESMIQHRGLIALEENKGFIQKLRELLETVLKKIKEGWEKLKLWFKKFTNILPKVSREAYNNIKALSEDEYKKGWDNLLANTDMAETNVSPIQLNGKMFDIQDLSKEVKAFMDAGKIDSKLADEALKVAKNEHGFNEYVAKDDKLLHQLITLGEKVEGKEITVFKTDYKYVLLQNKCASIDRTERKLDKPVMVEKSELLNCLNIGSSVLKEVEKYASTAEEDYKALLKLQATIKNEMQNMPEGTKLYVGGVNFYIMYTTYRNSLISHINQDMVNILKFVVYVANQVVKLSKEKGSTNTQDNKHNFPLKGDDV